jgi:HD-like signal output (HDOD) protein
MIKCSLLRQALGGNPDVSMHFSDHAADIAALAEAIARTWRSLCNCLPKQSYAAVLFMDCGMPVLKQCFPGYGQAFRSKPAGGCPDLLEEDRKVDCSHHVIGYLVARQWRLPESEDGILEAVRGA